MTKRTGLLLLVCSLLLQSNHLFAQCDPTKKYDKIVSGYHQSIALKGDGTFDVWGQDLNADGASDLLTPVTLNATNFPALTGTPLRAAIGGAGSSSGEQAIALTTTGIFAWGNEGNVLSSSFTTSNSFQKIIAPTGSDASTGLPSGVAPSDVDIFVASNKTLILTTTAGEVWVLTQMSAAVQGNGLALDASRWHKVMISASAPLQNVKEVRAQVSSTSASAFIALTKNGLLYTWGESCYLGNSSNVQSLSYATPMTLPLEFTSTNLPYMIGVTGGTKSGDPVTNTYYLVSYSGALYALGDNSKKQCADFTTTDRKSWVLAQKTSGVPFNNVRYLSVQEHDNSFPAISAITSNGDLYTWGENGGLMLGRTTDGSTYDPGFPFGFTSGSDFALFSEMGGHTLLYLKAGSTRFCYVGHKTNGSMGDGVSASTNLNVFDCLATPSITICGAVPILPSPITSTISTNKDTINADGSSTAILTIQLKDAAGNNFTTSGGLVTVSTSLGTLASVVDNNDGTYTVILTSSSTGGKADIQYTINGQTGTNTTAVVFKPTAVPPTISAQPQPVTVCVGNAINLSVTALASSSGNLSYQWRKAGNALTGANAATFNIGSALLSDAGSYDVIVTESGSNLSTTSNAVTVTIQALPATPTISVTGSSSICIGGNVTLTASPASSYTWYKNNVVISGANSQTYAATTSGTYTVIVTNASGCTSSASAGSTVTVNGLPSTPTITAGGPTTFCTPGSVTLTASSATSYTWYKDNAVINGANGQTYSTSNSGSYTVVVTNASGCTSSASAGTSVTANATPNTPSDITGLNITYPTKTHTYTVAPVAGATSYTWTLPSGWSGSSSSNSISITTGTSSGTIRVAAVANNCVSAAASLPITLKLFIADVLTPNNDGKNDQWKVVKPSHLTIAATIYNRWGQIVFKSNDYNSEFNGNGNGNFLGRQLPTGTYFFLLEITDRNTSDKYTEKGSLTLKRDY